VGIPEGNHDDVHATIVRVARIDLTADGPKLRRPMEGRVLDHALVIDTTETTESQLGAKND